MLSFYPEKIQQSRVCEWISIKLNVPKAAQSTTYLNLFPYPKGIKHDP